MKAKLVTVHILVPLRDSAAPHQEADVSDAVSEVLSTAERVHGTFVDWGYAKGASPHSGPTLDLPADYEEGEFYALAGVEGPQHTDDD